MSGKRTGRMGGLTRVGAWMALFGLLAACGERGQSRVVLKPEDNTVFQTARIEYPKLKPDVVVPAKVLDRFGRMVTAEMLTQAGFALGGESGLTVTMWVLSFEAGEMTVEATFSNAKGDILAAIEASGSIDDVFVNPAEAIARYAQETFRPRP